MRASIVGTSPAFAAVMRSLAKAVGMGDASPSRFPHDRPDGTEIIGVIGRLLAHEAIELLTVSDKKPRKEKP